MADEKKSVFAEAIELGMEGKTYLVTLTYAVRVKAFSSSKAAVKAEELEHLGAPVRIEVTPAND